LSTTLAEGRPECDSVARHARDGTAERAQLTEPDGRSGARLPRLAPDRGQC
jgi:hypothetical protein